MSITQGPYTVAAKNHSWYVAGPSITDPHWADKSMAERSCASLNAAYAEGQRSNQAELDKAVELLRELAAECPESYADGSYHLDVALRAARAYLSTLNPQPDAAQ